MFTDQIGRYFAVLIFAPLLVYKGQIYGDDELVGLGVLLFVWDLYWMLFREPKQSIHFRERGEEEVVIMIHNGVPRA
jgi:hypothetical protein